MLNIPVNNFSVMLGRSHCFLGQYSRTQHCDLSGARTPTSGSRVRGVNHDQATTPPSSGWVVKFLTCGCHERIHLGSSLRPMRPCKIRIISSKIKGVGKPGPTLWICTWARWTCLFVKDCLISLVILLLVPPEARH